MNGEHVTRGGIGHRAVRACSDCWGPVARCPACRRAHCDDTACPGCPIACAEALDAGPDATLADPTPPRSHP